MVCLSALLRKQWVEHERLSYPIVQLPLAMTNPKGRFFKSRMVWIGFGIAAGINLINDWRDPWNDNLPLLPAGFQDGRRSVDVNNLCLHARESFCRVADGNHCNVFTSRNGRCPNALLAIALCCHVGGLSVAVSQINENCPKSGLALCRRRDRVDHQSQERPPQEDASWHFSHCFIDGTRQTR